MASRTGVRLTPELCSQLCLFQLAAGGVFSKANTSNDLGLHDADRRFSARRNYPAVNSISRFSMSFSESYITLLLEFGDRF